jgi:YgiT-type zinc finger domain-containing protein
MICLICRQAQIVDGFSSIGFERGEFRLMVGRVPAHVCPSCGEAYVDEEVATDLLRIVEEVSRTGILTGVHEYTRGKE